MRRCRREGRSIDPADALPVSEGVGYDEPMSQPVEISDELIHEARAIGEVAGRSIADQIESWAQLGRVIEPLLEGGRLPDQTHADGSVPLSECLASVESEAGRRRLAGYLATRPFPHYEPVPGSPGLIVRVDADGTRITGRFVGREFRAVS